MPVFPSNSFRVDDCATRYSKFVPRLFNFCLSLGMKPNRIMPSRAFCSDENQGYPIMLIAKHSRSFPFNHGRVGGIIATDRHGPGALSLLPRPGRAGVTRARYWLLSANTPWYRVRACPGLGPGFVRGFGTSAASREMKSRGLHHRRDSTDSISLGGAAPGQRHRPYLN
jgi:hypothetical protein